MKKVKYIFVSLEIKCGTYEFSASTVHEISKKIDTLMFSNNYAKLFYSEKPDKNGDWYNFFGGEIAVKCKAAEEISKEEYDVLNKFQYK